MKKILKKTGILFAAVILLAAFPAAVRADGSVGRITLTECDLNTKQPVPGISLAIYQVAASDDSADGIAYTAEFAGLSSEPFQLPETVLIDGNNQAESTRKLEQYIKEHREIQPMQTAATDENGTVSFENLPDGVYFFRQVGQSQALTDAGKKVTAYSFFVSLPTTAGGAAARTITDAKPKCLVESIPQKTDLSVCKIWKDDSDKAGKRPDKIRVELLDGGVCVDTQVLSAANNWTFRWNSLETEGHIWSVQETSVPAGYTSAVDHDGYDFTITNTFHPSQVTGTPQVRTGDASHPALWICLIAAGLAGAAWLAGRKKK